jgi:hypothetical protein
MAIAFDAVTTDTYVGQTSRTIAHICTGVNRFLIVTIAVYTNAGGVTGVTYNGVAMTLTGTATAVGGAVVYQYVLVDPASGSNNVIVSLSGPNWYYSFSVVSYTGVDQATPYGTAVTANGPVSAPSVTVSSATDELVVDSLAARMDPVAPGTGQTQRALINNSVDGANIRAAMSDEAGAASVVMDWTGSGSTWAQVGLPLKPAASQPSSVAWLAA